MLILKIMNNKPRRRPFLSKRKISFNLSSFVLNNNIYYVAEVYPSDIYSENFHLLINKFKGSVLNTRNNEVNDYIRQYLFNPSSYVKRSLLCALCNELKSRAYIDDVVIYSNSFVFYPELTELVNCCKRLFVFGEENGELERFRDYCYSIYGLNVLANGSVTPSGEAVVIDLNNFHDDLYTEIKIGDEHVRVYAERDYFTDDTNVIRLTEYGVSQVLACAAIPKIPFNTVYVKHK